MKDRYYLKSATCGTKLQRNRFMPHVNKYVPYEVYWSNHYSYPGWKPYGMNYNYEYGMHEISEEDAFVWIIENQ